MNKNFSQFVMLLIGVSAYDVFFWQEKFGLNCLLFSAIMISYSFIADQKLKCSKPAVLTAFGTILTAILIVVNNSLFSKTIHILSFISFIGFSKVKALRFIWFSIAVALLSVIKTPLKIFQNTFLLKGKKHSASTVLKTIQLSLIPFLVLILFYFIYYSGNSNFSQISDSFWSKAITWFQWDISFGKFLFIINGLLLSGVVVYHFDFPIFKKLQYNLTENLVRKHKNRPPILKATMALKQEYQIAFITFVALNLLLLFVNFIDIAYVWFGYDDSIMQTQKAQYVHDGTYILIFSILMAMSVLLIFFRKNLNFYPKSYPLKAAAFLWIIQNGILGISLLIRNFRYIDYHGLAYKRIGVLIFLVMVFIGLLTMFYKIKMKKSSYFLWQRNTWALYFVMIFCCLINWDILITKFNLNHQTKTEIDFHFLVNEVSDKNLFLLIDYQQNDLTLKNNKKNIHDLIEKKKQRFIASQQNYSGFSWNFADYRNNSYLKNLK